MVTALLIMYGPYSDKSFEMKTELIYYLPTCVI